MTTHMATALLAASVGFDITGGASLTFTNLLSYVPERVPEQVSAEDTPGSSNWYAKVDSYRVPQSWAVYSNGIPVDADGPTLRTVGLLAECGDLNVAVDRPDGSSEPHFRGQVDTSWEGGTFYAVATNFTDFSCIDNYGFPLYWMKAHKLDKQLFSAFLASYCAYWERLYFGSACEGCPPAEGPGEFSLDATNYFVRSGLTNDFHRLLEYPNITNFTEHANEMFARLHADVPRGGEVPEGNRKHPAFAFCDGGLLDSGFSDPREAGDAYACWASSAKPPVVPQDVGTGDYANPDEGVLGSLMPYFPWTLTAIGYQILPDPAWYETQFWQCYALTLDGLFGGGESPIKRLFDVVGIAETAGPRHLLREYDCGKKLDFFRNAFRFAGREAPNADRADWMYGKCFGEYAKSRKALPGAFVGANQTLALMNRVIYVPTVNMAYSNVTCRFWRHSDFESAGEVRLNVEWDEGARVYRVKASQSNAVFKATLDTWTDAAGKDELSRSEDDAMVMRCGPVDAYAPWDSGSFGHVSSPISIDEEHVEQMFDRETGNDCAEIIGIADSADGVVVFFRLPSMSEGTEEEIFVQAERTGGELAFSPVFSVSAQYSAVVPDVDRLPWRAKKNLPLRSTCGKVSGSSLAYLDRRDFTWSLSGEDADTVTDYRCLGTETVSSFDSSAYNHYLGLAADMTGHAEDRIGDFTNPYAFVNFQDRQTFSVPAGSAFVPGAYNHGTSILSFSHNYEEPYLDCTFPLAGTRVFAQTNLVENVVLEGRHGYRYEVEENFVQKPEGWWVCESAVTNYVSSFYPGDSSYTRERVLSSAMTMAATNSSANAFFPRRELGKIQYEGIRQEITNVYEIITNYYNYLDVFWYTGRRVMTYADGRQASEPFEESATETNQYDAVDWDSEYSVSAETRFSMTGSEVVTASTNVEEITSTTSVPAGWRVYRSGRWEHYYLDPNDGEEVLIGEGEVPLVIGIFVAEALAAEGNTYDFSPPPLFFKGAYENRVKFSVIESNDYRFESMQLHKQERNTAP